MNKLLAFAQKRIPYIPELKPLCEDSIPATILMMQMEYWFASRPNGFYKFLRPCEHERYHVGDSWTEELQFSEHEFRSSFEKIGVRYKSKTQLELVPPGVDIFQGHYYLSYFDTRKSMTVYLRNHELIDEKLDALLDGFRAKPMRKREQVIDSNKDANIQSPEMESFNLRRLKKSTSGDEKIQSAYIGTDITTLDYNHKTTADINTALEEKPKIAAVGFEKKLMHEEGKYNPQEKPTPVMAFEKKLADQKIPSSTASRPIVACSGHQATGGNDYRRSHVTATVASAHPAIAADVKNSENHFPQMQIGKSLTDAQAMHVTKMAAEIVKNKRHPNATQLVEEMTFVMLSPETFTQAGNDFFKKLNTILKCIREGRWSRPTGLIEKDEKTISKTQQSLNTRRYELEGECVHWKQMAEIFKAKNNVEQMNVAMSEHKKALSNLMRFNNEQVKN